VVEFRVLGTVNLVGGGGRELRSLLAQPKRVALLAYLAAASPRRLHRRDSLVALFWPELDQEHARAALRQSLHILRRLLGEGTLESRGDDEVGLAEATVWCDAPAFDAAVDGGRHVEALELYRGDLLDGFFISGAPEFEHWLEDERARLRRRAGEAAWALAQACHAAGDSALAAHWARRGAALSRDDEGALRRLIGLLGELGDRAGAVQAYDTFARRLAEEYEVEPARETRALIASVRARETSPVSAPTASIGASPDRNGFLRPEAAGLDASSSAVSEPAVVEEPDSPADVGLVTPAPKYPQLEPVPENAAQLTVAPARRVFRRPVIAAGAAALIGAAVSLAFMRARTPPLDPHRIVVVPFVNRTGDSTLTPLGDLAADWITRGLGETGLVELADVGRVPVERESSAAAAARGTSDPRRLDAASRARELAIETESGTAVWGSFYRRGDSLEFAAQITDERSGKLLRSIEPIVADATEPRAGIRALRQRVTAALAAVLDPKLSEWTRLASQPPSYEAYQAFAAGADAWERFDGREALRHFYHAAGLDSTYTLPLVMAAGVHRYLDECEQTDSIVRLLSDRHPRMARLDRHFLEKEIARCRGDWAAAYRASRRMQEALPGSEWVAEEVSRNAIAIHRPREALSVLEKLHPDRGALRGRTAYYNWLHIANHSIGAHERELQAARRGRRQYPNNMATLRHELLALAALGRLREVNRRLDEIPALPDHGLQKPGAVMRETALELRAHGHPDGSNEVLRRALAWLDSRSPAEQATEASRFDRLQTLYAARRWEAARALAEQLAKEYPRNVSYRGMLGALAAVRGDREGAARADSMLAARRGPFVRGLPTYWRACIAARLGDRARAVALLIRADAEGLNLFYVQSYHADPSLESLRSYPPFEQFLRPKG
jgi:DNA-binding SARP family transcriptional activator/tetratricopeptide (TPR) repeat protein